MSSPFVAEIRIFAGNFAPTGWAFCSGQLLPISQNTALFSLVGTFYGGDGKSTFGLPNLRDSAPMHQGQGPGLTERFVGEAGGEASVTLLVTEIPFHNHTASGITGTASLPNPANNLWASAAGRSPPPLYSNSGPNTTMNAGAIGLTGGSQPHNNMQPYLGLSFIIAMQGIFPPRG
jgi:microcystin-dependent protein